ncbi:MAG TPA: ABC transporter permease [Anaerolineae bacterium]|nr:ABC transporter permease [Anaerolineae bacterium]
MNAITNTLAVAGKELRVYLKDRGTLAVLFLLPVVLASVFGSISQSFTGGDEGGETMSFPVALINLDDGAYGEQVTTVLKSIDVMDVNASLPLAVANQRVADGALVAAIVIPADFSARVDGYEPSTVQVIVDPTREQFGSIVAGIMSDVLSPVVLQGEIQYGIRAVMARSGSFEKVDEELRRATEAQTLGVIMTQLQRLQSDPWIAVRSEDPEGIEPQGPWNPMSYNVPAFSVMFAFFLVGAIAQTLWLEKEVGTFRRLLAAPIPQGAIIGGKVVANVLIVFLQFLVLFTVGNLAFKMPLGDSLLGLGLLTLATALTAAGLGILVAALTKSSRQADSLGTVLGFVLGGLGGCIFPLYQMEGFIGFLPRLVPQGQALIGFSRLLNEGAGVIELLPQIGVLCGMAGLFFLIGVWRFRFD